MPMKRSGRRRRSNKNFVVIPFTTTLTLGTLAAGVTIKVDSLGGALGEDLYVISMDSLCSIIGVTATEGPIRIGVAHDDLTVSEIQENLDAEMTDPDDIIAKERSRRPVREIGMFPGLSTNEILNNGVPLRTKIMISFGDTHNVAFWASNHSGATLTTGASIKVSGKFYGRWQR